MTPEELERRIKAARLHVTLGGRVDANTAAAVLKINPRTLWEWRQAGKGPQFTQQNRRVWYSLAALCAYLDAGEQLTDGPRRNGAA